MVYHRWGLLLLLLLLPLLLLLLRLLRLLRLDLSSFLGLGLAKARASAISAIDVISVGILIAVGA